MIFNKKAQGALEYLLLIGAAILIVAVVIVALSGIVVDTKDQNSVSDYNSQFEKLQDLQKKPGVYGSSESIAEIISFKVNGTNGLIQEENIIVTLPYGASLDDLHVEINANGVVNPSDSEIDFELGSEKIFTVTSIDNKNQKDYSVVINYALPVDENPPIINLIYPTLGKKIYEEDLTFEFSVADYSRISNCTLSFNSNNYTWSNISSGTYQKEVTLSLENEGINNWSVSCVDSENNSSEVISESFEVIFNNDSAQVVFLSVGGYGGNIQNDSIQITLPNGTDLTNLPFNVVVENGVISPNESRMSFNLGVPKNFILTSSDSTQRNFLVTVKYPSGSVVEDYIEVLSCQELQDIDKKLNGKYKLMNDIDCGGFNFKPIGGSTGFSGSLNGNGFEIRNLSITNSNFNLSYAGLFGILKGEVRNLKIVNGSMTGAWSTAGSGATLGGITGRQDAGSLIVNSSFNGSLVSKWNTGGIAGESSGTILRSYSSGSFSAGYSSSKSNNSWLSLGGIVGYQKSSGVVNNCYSSARIEVTGGSPSVIQQAAGLVGRSYGLIEDSYSYGQVIGPSSSASPYVLRGLVAADYNNNFSGTVIDSYWDVTTSGRSTSAGGVGLVTSEMKNSSNFVNWDQSIWGFSNDYPKLVNVCGDDYCDSLIDENCSTCPGDCGICLPPYQVYEMYSCWDLQIAQNDLTGLYILMNDVNCALDGVENFEPIGSYGNEFKGIFYGNGYSINNLKIDSSNSFVGLFGALKDALISGVVLKNVEIRGDNLVGGIVGSADSNSIIQYSLVDGKINSSGLIVGELTGTGGKIINCYSNVKIN